ncbi:Zinc finger C-x8-C-x5-C-x3-H type (and similar) [Carpediemonas membranifera]|uniref:Zinc finger C-x8-C-x5-C-x3-H type (And similar) n=1 Tax=Carpediemonas membranifera TaxID=201153 RepID=A0A8J6E9X7_9EUKA|nr:Zinc finger C-x8-C-x5-C-x3-H type (and similar) [Carpediemonas membranifera]|eukprot:KAG9393955.1 Zinc finger C-x8-C-x5-C-x3-H type (and similar) [Carpediemonas membranifera]
MPKRKRKTENASVAIDGSIKKREKAASRVSTANVVPISALDATEVKPDTMSPKESMSKTKRSNVQYQRDYELGICKDFYETGFCGYGDNCKFIHTREKQAITSKDHHEARRARRAEIQAQASAAVERAIKEGKNEV